MRLSIILISWNSLVHLKECLASLSYTLQKEDIEIIWVDNGSTDGASRYVKENYPQIQTVTLPCNQGVAYARNRGIEKASGKYILLLDDDTIANENAIYGMVAYMDFHPETGICGCKLTNTQKETQKSDKEYPGLGIKFKNIFYTFIRRKNKEIFHTVEYEPEYLIGACQMIRREVLDLTGLLDENIFYGPEDADFELSATIPPTIPFPLIEP